METFQMNTEKNIVLRVIDWVIQTLSGVVVIIFDGIHNAVNHATPSLFAMVATLLPFLLPLPGAFMSAHSAVQFFGKLDGEYPGLWFGRIGITGLGEAGGWNHRRCECEE
jgi:hypothetical protein